MKLLPWRTRAHTPDVESLSALADGSLDVSRARELESHITGCPACSATFDEIREVRSLLASMGSVEVPRSFRLRPADVRPPAAGLAAPAVPMRWAPALSAVAAALFVAVLATDFATRDGDGGGDDAGAGLAAAPQSQFESADRSMEAATAASDATGADDFDLSVTPAAGMAAPEALVPRATSCTPSASEESDGCPPSGEETLLGNATEDAARRTADAQQVEAASREAAEDDEGNRIGFRIVEVMTAIVAAGAAIAFIAVRRRREGAT
jgi:hypothetical protein